MIPLTLLLSPQERGNYTQYASRTTRYEMRATSNELGVTLIELILGLVIFAIIVPGIILILSKGMETFFFEREEVVVQRDMRNVMDKITDDLREASSIDTATQTDVSFNDSSKKYYLNGENIRDIDDQQINSSEVKVVGLSFLYYKEDMETLTTDPNDVKAVEIKMEFQKDDNPIMELKSCVLIRNLL